MAWCEVRVTVRVKAKAGARSKARTRARVRLRLRLRFRLRLRIIGGLNQKLVIECQDKRFTPVGGTHRDRWPAIGVKVSGLGLDMKGHSLRSGLGLGD